MEGVQMGVSPMPLSVQHGARSNLERGAVWTGHVWQGLMGQNGLTLPLPSYYNAFACACVLGDCRLWVDNQVTALMTHNGFSPSSHTHIHTYTHAHTQMCTHTKSKKECNAVGVIARERKQEREREREWDDERKRNRRKIKSKSKAGRDGQMEGEIHETGETER